MIAANASYAMSFTRELLTALAIIIGAALALTLYAKLRPRFTLRVCPSWEGDRLTLRLEIENISNVYAAVESAYIEVDARTLDKGGWLTQWVRFSKGDETDILLDPDALETKRETRIYPGEVLAVERIYDFPADDALVQVGLQVKLKAGWPILRLVWRPGHQQTTTRYFVKPAARPAA